MNRENLLMQLMELDFARYDLRLYLNTHPGDEKALQHFNNLTREADHLRKEFEKEFGPLSYMDMSDEHCFTWIDDPWPWERHHMAARKEGER